ncbi:MAG TPA: glutaredoxin family protein [Steroidobacteraceae bacterium]|nr:glutaredoxin family protein [Steroidobacteraceae bacterium]
MTTDLVLYVREGCHLCEQFLLDLSLDFPTVLATLRTADVDADPELATTYGLRVPVLAAAGVVVCEGRYDPAKVGTALGL